MVLAAVLLTTVGILGIATAAETVATSVPGAHGGNLDTRLLREGAAVAFRAHQPGLGLAAGDVHAAMGDGELGGTGIEIAGRVQLSVERYTGPVGSWPLLFADDAAHVLASAADVDTAVRAGFGEAVALRGKHVPHFKPGKELRERVSDVQPVDDDA